MIETHATLTLYTGDEDPADLYASMGVAEAEITRPSDVRAGARLPKPAWRLTSETRVDGDAATHIHWLLDRVEPHVSVLRSAVARGCDATVWVYWSTDNAGPYIELDGDVLRRIADLGLSLRLDAYRNLDYSAY